MRKTIVCLMLLCVGVAFAEPPAGGKVKHRFFKCGWASGGPGIYDENFKCEWSLADPRELSDGWVLPDGGVVYSFSERKEKDAGVVRLGPDKEKLWEFHLPQGHDNHSCMPLPHGGFLLGESAKDGLWMTELDKDGKKLLKRVQLSAGPVKDIHHSFRNVRKTPQGTYLGVLMGGGANDQLKAATYEWDANGKVVAELPGGFYVPVRLPNGNTIITGHGQKGKVGFATEYDPAGKKVWELTAEDAERLGIRLAMACGVQRLPNGNTVVTNVKHGTTYGPESGPFPKAVEVTPDKQLVWMIPQDAAKGNMGCLQILDVKGDPTKFEVCR